MVWDLTKNIIEDIDILLKLLEILYFVIVIGEKYITDRLTKKACQCISRNYINKSFEILFLKKDRNIIF